jgi:S-adenosylmethionine decarboxylase proenzyme
MCDELPGHPAASPPAPFFTQWRHLRVAVLAESHISVHTWPERSFGAFDIFMCGNARPEEAVPILKRAFSPRTMHISKYLRGEAGNA